jgi:hypothetical protein
MFFRILLGMAAVLVVMIAANSVWKMDLYLQDLVSALLYLILPITVFLVLLGLQWAKAGSRQLVTVNLIAAGIAVFSFEMYQLYRGSPGEGAREAARQLGIAYDDRSWAEVVRDFRQTGRDVVPAMMPGPVLSTLAQLGQDAQRLPVLGIGGISNAKTVFCNEHGPFVSYQSDRYGFNNPDANWDSDGPHVVLIGDSFGQGVCVKQTETIAANLDRSFANVINLSMGGNGPLIQLATIVEYAVQMRPWLVVWLFTEANDLGNMLTNFRRSPALARYVVGNQAQGLMERQPEIDQYLRALSERIYQNRIKVDDAARQERAAHPYKQALQTTLSVMKLQRTRRTLRLDPTLVSGKTVKPAALANFENELSKDNINSFDRVIRKAKTLVEGQNGRMLFVYLPSRHRFHAGGQIVHHYEGVRKQVIKRVREADIDMVDLLPAMLEQGDPRDLYYHPGSHLTVEGYRLVSDIIIQHVKQTGGEPER